MDFIIFTVRPFTTENVSLKMEPLMIETKDLSTTNEKLRSYQDYWIYYYY